MMLETKVCFLGNLFYKKNVVKEFFSGEQLIKRHKKTQLIILWSFWHILFKYCQNLLKTVSYQIKFESVKSVK